MKIKTIHAAQRAGLHPLNFVLQVSRMVGGLSDCWPEIDDGYVETILAMNLRHDFKNPEPAVSATASQNERQTRDPATAMGMSATRVLDKLERGGRWGTNAISFDTLRNHFCQGVPDIEDAVGSLVESGMLLAGSGRKGPYSLNPERKGDIEQIVREIRETPPR